MKCARFYRVRNREKVVVFAGRSRAGTAELLNGPSLKEPTRRSNNQSRDVIRPRLWSIFPFPLQQPKGMLCPKAPMRPHERNTNRVATFAVQSSCPSQ